MYFLTNFSKISLLDVKIVFINHDIIPISKFVSSPAATYAQLDSIQRPIFLLHYHIYMYTHEKAILKHLL